MTAEEKRLAEELKRVVLGSDEDSFAVLARHVLRRERAAVRRARGRTIGWACHMNYEPLLTLGEAQMQVDACGGTLARVVAVPRKGGRRG